MRHVSLSICALAGAIMAAVGTHAEGTGRVNWRTDLDTFGMFLAGAFSLFTLVSVIRATRMEEAGHKNEGT